MKSERNYISWFKFGRNITIDRIVRGYVIDFIYVNLFNFPNFNIADISITVGIILLIIVILKSIRNDREKA